MRVLLIGTYELGRQSFGLASAAAWLCREGAEVAQLDLHVGSMDDEAVMAADLVAYYIPMHTATRLAVVAARRARELNPSAYLCFFGLYAPMNESLLRSIGGSTILGGEFEEGLAALYRQLSDAGPKPVVDPSAAGSVEGSAELPQGNLGTSLGRQTFIVPDRRGMAALDRYAKVRLAPGDLRTAGYTEASRGCKHLCRHCPIVPVYRGRLRLVQQDVVIADVAAQVAAGARHITFGDPDFLNAPSHAKGIVGRLHEQFPHVTYDITVKVEHLLKHSGMLPWLRDTGCLFVTSAVESADDRVLRIFDKGHTVGDFIRVVASFREAGMVLNPTFVSFTPWTSIPGYVAMLALIAELGLVEHVAPIQYAIRLLVPQGSRLLDLPEVRKVVGHFDEAGLCHRWSHPDASVDRLHHDVVEIVAGWTTRGGSRPQVFESIWRLANDSLDHREETLQKAMGWSRSRCVQEPCTIPYMTEPWYC